MGMTAYSRLILGVPVARTDFFTVTGQHRECARCHQPQGKDAQYCAHDGAKIVTVDDEEPTLQFANYATKWEQKPQELYAELCDPGDDEVGLRQCDLVQCSEDARHKRTYALGLLLSSVDDERMLDRGHAVRVDQLPVERVQQTAQELGLGERPLQLFSCLYISI